MAVVLGFTDKSQTTILEEIASNTKQISTKSLVTINRIPFICHQIMFLIEITKKLNKLMLLIHQTSDACIVC